MQTYTTRRNLFGDLTNNSASATLSFADKLMNMAEKRLVSTKDWDFLDRRYTLSTIVDTFTVTIASPAVFSLTAHTLSVGSVVYFSTSGALPTGLTAGTAYYVISAGLTADAFEVSAAVDGTVVNTSGSQSGTHTVSTMTYILPAYTKTPKSVYVTVGSYRYTPKEVTTQRDWDRLNEVVTDADITTHYRVYDGYLELYPKPSTNNSVVTINARRIQKDLSVADYTTGTVDIAPNGSQLITGDSTVWASPMEGRWIKIDQTDVATTSGDGYWYEIAKVVSGTTLLLRKPYGGTALTTGAAATYTIGEASLIPEPHDMIPIYEALQIYYTSVDPDKQKAELYGGMLVDSYNQMVLSQGKNTNVVLDDGGGDYNINPNLLVSL